MTETEANDRLEQALAAYQSGRLHEAVETLATLAAEFPDNIRYVGNLGNVYGELDRHAEALKCHDRVVGMAPDHAGAHFNRGLALSKLQRDEEALAAYAEALALKSDFWQAQHEWGCTSWRLGREDKAMDAWRLLLTWLPEGPDRFGTLSALGIAMLSLGNADQAVDLLDAAAVLSPQSFEVQYHRASALNHLGRLEESLAGYEAALRLQPGDQQCLASIAWSHLQLGAPERALSGWQQAARSKPRTSDATLSRLPRQRLLHDVQQVRWLSEHVGIDEDASRWLGRAEALLESHEGPYDLSGPELAPTAQRVLHLESCPPVAGGALNPALDEEVLMDAYQSTDPSYVVIDDFLSPEALASMRRHVLGSTMWASTYRGGYLGAFMETGLATPLVLQISDELQRRFGRVYDSHSFVQCWAFKYDQRLKGINIHADVAAVNLNFWITPDDACLGSDDGGLVIWDVESPGDWSFSDYNTNGDKIRAYLKAHKAKSVVVPHRANRAVLFSSALFHETDHIHFRPGYENRRVNITLLHGLRLRQ